MLSKALRRASLLPALGLLALAQALLAAAPTQAQTASRTFPETGKTVTGRFLDYWNTHGGLPQQGFPISGEMQERSDTDGKTYTVQYFERAVFERHPKNAAPYDVLLSLLGNFRYKQKYPSGAPGQQPNTTYGSILFPQTGKHLAGRFLQYWQQNGGLAQQGYPISEEFSERSDLDGKTYKVQYFERAVFERHPENAAPYDVLLSQLGTFRYRAKYSTSDITPTAIAAATPTTHVATEQQMTATLREWALDTSATTLKPGKVKITVNNTGTMDHNLAVINSSGQTLAQTPNFRPSEGPKTLEVTLQPGTYTLLCTLPGHAQRGQLTHITVK
ncbi:MAG: hypothetical protein ACJ78Q_11360 [Chloroflexia bacterium]